MFSNKKIKHKKTKLKHNVGVSKAVSTILDEVVQIEANNISVNNGNISNINNDECSNYNINNDERSNYINNECSNCNNDCVSGSHRYSSATVALHKRVSRYYSAIVALQKNFLLQL